VGRLEEKAWRRWRVMTANSTLPDESISYFAGNPPRQSTAHLISEEQFMSRLSSCRLVAGLFVAFATLVAIQTNQVAAKDGGLVGVEGMLVAVDPTAGSLTIRTRRMQDVTVTVNGATKIERNERRATLAMFQLGDRVEAKLASATSNLAVKVEATGP
jgi:hypothetical protein